MELTSSNVWVLASAGLVLVMTPGVAFLYAGMTRVKGTLNMLLMVFSAMGIVPIMWALFGYAMSSGDSVAGLFGNPFSDFGLVASMRDGNLITVGFSATFAMIAVGLIAGAVADRMKFTAWVIFAALWVLAVYAPLAFMVWGGGLLTADGLIGSTFGEAIDFAGGLVVHMNAGGAAFALALLVGKRRGFGTTNMRPHNLPLVFVGVALLWFGWFGFNAGAASTAEQAGLIWVNTMLAPAAGLLSWIAVERIRKLKPTSLGAGSGVIAGLVGITPACANVSPLGAIAIGVLCGVASALAAGLKFRIGLDDSLDVIGLHLVAGLVGTLMIGFLALPADGFAGGLFYGGGFALVVSQSIAALVATVYSVVVSLIIAYLIKVTVGLRIHSDDESIGIDNSEHAEIGYDLRDLNETPGVAILRD